LAAAHVAGTPNAPAEATLFPSSTSQRRSDASGFIAMNRNQRWTCNIVIFVGLGCWCLSGCGFSTSPRRQLEIRGRNETIWIRIIGGTGLSTFDKSRNRILPSFGQAGTLDTMSAKARKWLVDPNRYHLLMVVQCHRCEKRSTDREHAMLLDRRYSDGHRTGESGNQWRLLFHAPEKHLRTLPIPD